MTGYYTENLSDFGYRELELLKDLLDAWLDKGLPNGFYDEQVRPAFNRCSGNVFLVNSEYQVAMVYGQQLELFHSLPYSGKEGFLEELMGENNPSDLEEGDLEYLLSYAESLNFIPNQHWVEFLEKRNSENLG